MVAVADVVVVVVGGGDVVAGDVVVVVVAVGIVVVGGSLAAGVGTVAISDCFVQCKDCSGDIAEVPVMLDMKCLYVEVSMTDVIETCAVG